MIGRATGLRPLGLEVQGQILHVDGTQLAILPNILTALLDGRWWFHAWKGRVIRRRNVGRWLVVRPVRGGVMVSREDRRGSSESAGREGGGRSMVVEGGGVGLFGHLGATTGFIIGHADDRVVHDTWRDHPTGFGTPDRSRCPSPFPQFFFLPRNAGAAPPPPPPPLPVTRSQRRNKTLARFCFGPPPPLLDHLLLLFPFFRSPLLLPPFDRSFFIGALVVESSTTVFLSLLSFSMPERDRPRTSYYSSLLLLLLPSSFLLLASFCLFVETDQCCIVRRSIGRNAVTIRDKSDGRPPGIGILPIQEETQQLGNRRDRIFAGSTVHAILEPRTQNLVVLERWLSSGDNDTTYRDTR